MSPQSGRQNLAQGEASAASETLGSQTLDFDEPALAGDRRYRTARGSQRVPTMRQPTRYRERFRTSPYLRSALSSSKK
jgi:hypothetical protein